MIENGQPGGGYLLKHGSLQIPFKVQFGERQQLMIHVHPELRLEVLAPAGREIGSVLKRVDARSTWIANQWRYFERYQPTCPPRRYVSGETYLYLGRQYRLKVAKGRGSSVKLKGRFFHVLHNDRDDRDGIQRLVTDWYRDHACRLFKDRMANCLDRCKSLKLSKSPLISVRPMKRRWGSCTNSGNITLNLELVKTPVHCIDYVIAHELCHLKVHNHSPAFYRLLSRVMPDWEKRKDRLDSEVWA
ncbi:MAG: SprT family zinc-dependent metalloprotease [Candidatus Paceibacterota bacterium]